MPEPVTFAIAVGTVGVAKAGYDIAAPIVTNRFNGRAHTEKGGKLMDETINILTNPELSGSIKPSARQQYLTDHQALQPVRQVLEKSTSTMAGSIMHSSEARLFHSQAKILRNDARTASDSARITDQLAREGRPGIVHRQTEAQTQAKGNRSAAENQARERPLKMIEGQAHGAAPQAFELKTVEGQKVIQAQGRFEASKLGGSTSTAEARLRTILGPGGRITRNHPLAL